MKLPVFGLCSHLRQLIHPEGGNTLSSFYATAPFRKLREVRPAIAVVHPGFLQYLRGIHDRRLWRRLHRVKPVVIPVPH